MAWRFRVLGVQDDDTAVVVRVRYFDDAAPTVVLAHRTLRLPADTTRAQARAAIIAEGRRLRDAVAARTLLAQDVGSEGAVT
jgi:hypothetical protein